MNEPTPSPVAPAAPLPWTEPASAPVRPLWQRLLVWVAAALLAFSLGLAWVTSKRLRQVEQELVRRQQESQNTAGSAQMLAKQAQANALDSAAKVALLEARIAEVAVQRGQLEEVIQSLSRTRDENVVGDIEATLRVAQQQAALTGSAEPLMVALKQADDRLARYSQPRLERVRRAIASDLDRVRSVAVADVAVLNVKLDELVRMTDELPMLSQAQSAQALKRDASIAAASVSATASAGGASAPAPESAPGDWLGTASGHWHTFIGRVWDEARALVRVSRIDHPDAALMAPEQAFFVRENFKLRVLNARLALLSRQFDAARADLSAVQAMLDRYFDRSSRRTVAANEIVRQVSASTQHSALPRPEETIAALAAAAAGR